MVAAGLPQIPSKMGEAKTYAERLFEFIILVSLMIRQLRERL